SFDVLVALWMREANRRQNQSPMSGGDRCFPMGRERSNGDSDADVWSFGPIGFDRRYRSCVTL
ncbi:MAG TPA: hypothetical protein PLV85_07615, partial [Polyangiaceae bacterium]|nr:hypothetical protein [Polyangiaceae bacterium]